MSNQEILEKALKKAIDGGYPWVHEDPRYELDIFNHDFAKALWGGNTDVDMEGSEILADWQYHLQEMVIADDPIRYLGENI